MMFASDRRFIFNKVIASDVTNYNLKADAIAAGWDQIRPLVATVTVNSGIVVSANSTAQYAFDTGVTFPAGTTLALINKGSIVGMGGRGGDGSGAGINGLPGGPALRAQFPLSLDNSSGTIGGGGGGGGCMIADPEYGATTSRVATGGSGGRSGRTNAAGGTGTTGGNVGTFNNAGTYALTGLSTPSGYGFVYGGAGGGWGSAGQTSWVEGGGGSIHAPFGYGYGGAGGSAVVGNSNITWLAAGTRLGALT